MYTFGACASTAVLAALCCGLFPVGAFDAAAQVRETLTQVETVDIEAVAGGGAELYDGTAPSSVDILNEGVDAWIRIRPTLSSDAGEAPVKDGSLVEEGAWSLAADGWFYRTRPLDEGGRDSFAVPIQVPASWGRGIVIDCDFEVQAVQAKHFVPDMDADSPWGDLEPESAVYVRKGSEDGDEIGIAPQAAIGSRAGGERMDGETEGQAAGYADASEAGAGQ